MINRILVKLILIFCFIPQVAYTQSGSHNFPLDEIQSVKKKGYSVDACYTMAEDFMRSNADQIKAIPLLEFVLEKDRNSRPGAIYMLAQAYYYYGNFDKSINLVTEYLQKEKNGQFSKEAKIELEKYKNAKLIASSPQNAELINLGQNINSKFADINPYISSSENLLVYSSNRSKCYNIYVSKKGATDNDWNLPKQAGSYINTANDEFVAGLSSSGKNLFVHYNQLSGFEDINMSVREKGLFRDLGDPGNKINTTYREEGACMTDNGDTMFFASDKPGGIGGFDIYYSLRLPDGSYGTPINIGEPINTKSDENYPNLSPDGKKLYFASKGHNSIGGYDIFYTSYDNGENSWKTPVNLGYPINNAFDNKSIAFTEDPRYAYISTINWETNGDYDIYKVIFLNQEPDFLIIKAEVFVQDSNDVIPFNSTEDELDINVFTGTELYGKYTFDKRNNSFVIALKPGIYILDLESEKHQPYRKKITINENYYENNFRLLRINLEKKTQ
jgi:hypothetical protein